MIIDNDNMSNEDTVDENLGKYIECPYCGNQQNN